MMPTRRRILYLLIVRGLIAGKYPIKTEKDLGGLHDALVSRTKKYVYKNKY